ncbi:hypothetical protein [Undibacterium pigrum]|uniref:Uncharacterized protein n=1 Tax=Undibacterium pigrum TaxID=401470 RepID=A0A318JHU6_9BURK|nr:hypothetical protein [Undibacterium pigrum]PXX46792.1 hypothetical protein DFR42_101368 [Undibacterium pigrum]
MSSNSISNSQASSKRFASIMNTTINAVIQDAANKRAQSSFNDDIQRNGIFADEEHDFLESSTKLTASLTRNATKKEAKKSREEFDDDELFEFMDEEYQDDLRLSDAMIFDGMTRSSLSDF